MKNEASLRYSGLVYNIKPTNIHFIRVPEGEKKKTDRKVYLKKLWLMISLIWRNRYPYVVGKYVSWENDHVPGFQWVPGMSHQVRLLSITQERIPSSNSEVKAGLSRQIRTSQTDCGYFRKWERLLQCMGLSLWS